MASTVQGVEKHDSERQRRVLRAQAATADYEWLVWLARFRFVVAEDLAQRFDVTARRATQRLARMTADGWVIREAPQWRHLHHLCYLSGRGARLLGIPERKPPTRQSLDHERAIAQWVTKLERDIAHHGQEDTGQVLTERDCRQREAQTGERYSVLLDGGKMLRRWPDVVLQRDGHPKLAYEIEFAAKSSQRLRSILRGYRNTPHYARVGYFVDSPALAGRLIQLASGVGALPRLEVHPWVRLDELAQNDVRAAVDSAGKSAGR